MIVPKLKNFRQGVPEISCSQESDRQTERWTTRKHNAYGHGHRRRGGIKIHCNADRHSPRGAWNIGARKHSFTSTITIEVALSKALLNTFLSETDKLIKENWLLPL